MSCDYLDKKLIISKAKKFFKNKEELFPYNINPSFKSSGADVKNGMAQNFYFYEKLIKYTNNRLKGLPVPNYYLRSSNHTRDKIGFKTISKYIDEFFKYINKGD